ncbi:MAG: hypothetical protein FJX52_07875, partial [Alphaproteobacteria bacterium]|nr:hypothetical protein [Alphaproteobacteria bacterium]
MTAVPSYATATDRNNFQAFNDAQKAAAVSALNHFSEVANIRFVEVSGSGYGGAIRFGTNNQRGIGSGYANYPTDQTVDPTGGDIYLANDQTTNSDMTVGSWGYVTMMHEIGHAVGLKHPGNYNAGSPAGTGGDPPYLSAQDDHAGNTLMSYNPHISRLNVSTLMQYDMQALQYVYGANTVTRAGNTTYTFTKASIETIWDGGGTDTIDTTAISAGTKIDLRAGHFSSIGTNGYGDLVSNGVMIAPGVTIENARTGAGNDSITGNGADNALSGGAGNDDIKGLAGNDTLDGGSGSDTLEGGAGNDTYIVDSTSDVVRDSASAADTVIATNQEAFDFFNANKASMGIETVTLRASGGRVRLFDDTVSGDDGGGSTNTGSGDDGVTVTDDTVSGSTGGGSTSGSDGGDTVTTSSTFQNSDGSSGSAQVTTDSNGDKVIVANGTGDDKVSGGKAMTWSRPAT